ncbi:hypothetical protein F2Q69_00056855 [Brassica cretica]|uniref:Uncharacterized protein n=1 Tax=Brassica cretica TaxID=69181 RepID=A0A8S9N6P1_BRACR|nr:hypothetical protein F2Q69_00056855 [Brassica cretica]
MFMETKEEMFHIEIDRSGLLDQSILQLADATTLNSDILARFKREEAYGDGVVLEWYFQIRYRFGKLMFMETKEEMFHIEIDRSGLLDQSILQLADATTLNSDILARFKREEAYEDIRPNHASFVDEDYLKKFKFAGLIIDLAYFLSQFSWKVGPLGSGKKSHSLKV